MKFTLSWLKDHLETDATLDRIVEKLTALGLEVEGVEDRSKELKPFRVAIAVAKALDYRGGEEGRERFQTEAIATLFDACGNSQDREIDDLLLQLFNQTSAEVIEKAMAQAGMPFSPLN